MMKNAFYFTLKALIVLKIFQFLSSRFGHGEKTADEIDFKMYGVTTWESKFQYTYCSIFQEVNAIRQFG